jgi:hypothetical protein
MPLERSEQAIAVEFRLQRGEPDVQGIKGIVNLLRMIGNLG